MKRFFLLFSLLSFCVVVLACFTACGVDPVSIEVSAYPDSLTVPQGGTIDLSGGMITVTYSDKSTKEVPMSKLKTRGLDVNTVSSTPQTLVLVYSEKGKTFSTTIEMTVTLPKATQLTLSTEGVKTNYLVGSDFEPQGLVVTALLETGAEITVTNYDFSPKVMTLDTTSVKISFRGASATIPVTVVEKRATELKITKNPTKTTYFEGDDFSPAGTTAVVYYNDDTQKSLSVSDLSFTHPYGGEFLSPTSVADNVVVVSYDGVKTNITLTVTKVVPVRLVARVTGELSFKEYENFSFGEDKVSVDVYFNNKETPETFNAIDGVFSCVEWTLRAGQTEVEIYYEEYDDVTTSLPVTVTARAVTAINVLPTPELKTTYTVGQAVDMSGLVLLVTKEGNFNEQLSYSAESGITCSPTTLSSEGDAHVTVFYKGQSATYPVTVQ